MPYQVKLTPGALNDIEEFVQYVTDEKQDPGGALKWYDGLTEALFSLQEMPAKCPLVPEFLGRSQELRQLHYFSHRVVFKVVEADQSVRVLRIYHSARRELEHQDVE